MVVEVYRRLLLVFVAELWMRLGEQRKESLLRAYLVFWQAWPVGEQGGPSGVGGSFHVLSWCVLSEAHHLVDVGAWDKGMSLRKGCW